MAAYRRDAEGTVAPRLTPSLGNRLLPPPPPLPPDRYFESYPGAFFQHSPLSRSSLSASPSPKASSNASMSDGYPTPALRQSAPLPPPREMQFAAPHHPRAKRKADEVDEEMHQPVFDARRRIDTNVYTKIRDAGPDPPYGPSGQGRIQPRNVSTRPRRSAASSSNTTAQTLAKIIDIAEGNQAVLTNLLRRLDDADRRSESPI